MLDFTLVLDVTFEKRSGVECFLYQTGFDLSTNNDGVIQCAPRPILAHVEVSITSLRVLKTA